MKVAIRVDSSMHIGSGHLVRCLTLAKRLEKQGARVFFIMRDLPGHLGQIARKQGFECEMLPPPEVKGESIEKITAHSHWLGVHWERDAWETAEVAAKNQPVDWLVVDHYAIDAQWENILRQYVGRIMVLDDLADRVHECDLLLDQNYLTDMHTRYRKIVPGHCRTFLGPRYALLRKEFYRARSKLRDRTGEIERIFVFFGGYDSVNATGCALRSLLQLKRTDIQVDVVAGEANPHIEDITDVCRSQTNFHLYRQVENMAELMNRCDLGLGAGGATMWERCFLGLPALVTIIAENQRHTTHSTARYGAVGNLGDFARITEKLLTEKLRYYFGNPSKVCHMGIRSIALSGEGAGPHKQDLVESLWIRDG